MATEDKPNGMAAPPEAQNIAAEQNGVVDVELGTAKEASNSDKSSGAPSASASDINPAASGLRQRHTEDSRREGDGNGGNGGNPAEGAAAEEPFVIRPATYGQLFKYFIILGFTAFGGPAAHIAYFQKLFVERLHFLTLSVYAELLMLGQCLPGPSSTQTGFAIGVLKKGILGGMISGVCFQGPGAVILTILGWVASKVLDTPPDWLNGIVAGLAAAGIALVADAALGLVYNICKGKLLGVVCTAAGVIAYYYPKPWTFPAVIVAGGVVTWLWKWYKKEVVKVPHGEEEGVERLGFNKLGGTALIVVWLLVLVLTSVFAGSTDYDSNKLLHWWAVFYRTGSVIFGGGQVVLPLLFNEVVDQNCTYREEAGKGSIQICVDSPDSWMNSNQFYAGLALAQAMPGPLFNFAAYLGAVMAQNAGINAIAGAALCWLALFSPGIILIFGILPWWGSFRRFQIYRRALPGLNSAGIGLIVISVIQLTLKAWSNSPFPNTTICIGIIAYSAVRVLKVPAPLVVVGGGVLGVIGWAAGMN